VVGGAAGPDEGEGGVGEPDGGGLMGVSQGESGAGLELELIAESELEPGAGGKGVAGAGDEGLAPELGDAWINRGMGNENESEDENEGESESGGEAVGPLVRWSVGLLVRELVGRWSVSRGAEGRRTEDGGTEGRRGGESVCR
jgi:hypothetical protein